MSIRASTDEKGTLVIAFGVVLVVCFVGVVAFMVDNIMMQNTREYAFYQAEKLCSAGSAGLPVARHAVQRIISWVNLIEDSDPSTSVIDIDNRRRIAEVDIISPTPPQDLSNPIPFLGSDGPVDLSGMGFSENCPSGTPCLFYGDVESGEVAPDFPSGFWNRDDFGELIGCRVKVEVDTFLSGTQIVTGKVAYKAAMKNSTAGLPPRGITVGLALEGEVWDEPDSRFEFSPGGQFSAQNPLENFDPASKPSSGNLAFGFDTKWYTDPRVEGFVVAGAFALSGDERKQMLRHASNPHTNIVGLFLQSLIGRLIRMGEVRGKMNLALINPLGRSGESNPPTLMLQWGQDPMAREYDWPFINYAHNGTKGDGKYLCPFVNGCGSSQRESVSRHHRIVATQLRDALSVNNQENGTITLNDGLLNNAGFEPNSFASLSQVFPPYNGTSKYWGTTGESASRMPVLDLLRNVSVIEECPYNWSAVPNRLEPGCTAPIPNTNDSLPPVGLVGDIVSFLKFAQGRELAFPSEGPVSVTGQKPKPSVPNPESDVGQLRSDIILILFKRVPPALMDRIRTQVDDITASGRKIMVVYFPTNSTDASATSINNLKIAFNAQTAQSPNKVFALFPSSCPPAWFPSESLCYRAYWEYLLSGIANNKVIELGDAVFKELFDVVPAL
ncbi:MAG: hypothetical protein D6808_05130 [Candidatus Dadabacteria bacterium]|nr:MAG: hypothetical protein D6808_05130 [Candidatus Dadabacteria bacterium]